MTDRKSRKPSKGEMAAHVAAISERYAITVTHNTTGRGFAWKKLRKIRVPPVRSDVTYFIALHEIGHIVAPGAGGGRNIRLVEEALVWQWAMQNALAPPSVRVRRMIHRSLSSYMKRARRRRGM